MEGNKTLYISIFIAVLFHVSGLVGMLTDARPWFISMTPLTLVLMTGLIIWNEKIIHREFILFFGLCFSFGYLSELIGTSTGLLFGEYSYGYAMGYMVLGVPLLIGIQWFVTVYSIGHTVLFGYSLVKGNGYRSIFTNFLLVIFAAGLTTLFDFILEPSAVSLGYWEWHPEGLIPFFNYISWFFISGFLLVPFFMLEQMSRHINYFSIILIFIQTIFFLLV